MSDQSQQSKFEKVVNPKNIKRGVFYFLAITIISLTAIFIYTNTGKTLDIWKKINWKIGAFSLIFIFNDLWLGGLRNHIFARQFEPGIKFMVAFKANVANIFMGAVTPSQTGGGVAHWYVFWKNGLKTPDFILLSFINFISTILFFLISGWVAMNILQDKIPEGFVNYLASFGFRVFTTIGILVITALIFPQFIGKILYGLGMVLSRINQSWSEKVKAFAKKIEKSMTEYQVQTKDFLRRKPHLMLYSLVITILLYFNKYLLAYFLVLALGLDADFWTVIAIQAVVYLLLYFAPSPGGSGIAELSISAMMANVIPGEYTASFTLLYRSFLIFIPALIGAYVLLSTMNMKKVEQIGVKEK